MGKIQEYPAITTPATNDLLFIGDTSTSNQIHNITVQNLHTVPAVRAAGAAGLGLTNNAGSYGLFIQNSNAFVGVGTATPNRLLHIYNNTGTVATNSQVRIENAGAGDAYIYMAAGTDWSFGIDNSDGDKFKFNISNDVSDGTEVLTFQRDGNVGVGTAAPGDLLEVSGSASSTAGILTRINFDTGSGAAASYGGIRFTEDGAAKAYITYMGSNFTTAGRRETLEFRSDATASTGGIAFFPSNSGDADVFFRGDGKVGIGDNAWSVIRLPQAALHVKGTGVVAAGDESLLRVEAVSGHAAIYLKDSGSAQPGYIVTNYNNLFIGASVVPAANTHLQISKSTGRLIVGGPLADFAYPLTVGNISSHMVEVPPPGSGIWVPATGSGLKPTVARFIGYNATEHGTIDGKTFLVLTNPVDQPQLGIVYQSAGSTGAVQWLSGSFYGPDDVNYFGWRYLAAPGYNINDPDRATFYSTTLENNTVYISSANTVSSDIAECTGGINAANTAAAFGSVNGNGTTSPVVTAAYNATVAVSAAVATITFTKELSNTAYTVIANGWNVTDDEVMFGEVTARTAGSAGPPIVPPTCQITFRGTTVPNLQTADVRWTFVVYGAKFKE